MSVPHVLCHKDLTDAYGCMPAESQLVWLDTRTALSPVSQCLDSAFQDLTLHDDDTVQKSYVQGYACGKARVIMLLSHCRSGWAWVINSNFARQAPHVDCRLNPARRTQVIDTQAASECDLFVDAADALGLEPQPATRFFLCTVGASERCARHARALEANPCVRTVVGAWALSFA